MGQVSVRQRLPRDLAWIIGVACAVNAAMVLASSGLGYDSHAYWLTGQGGDLYGRAPITKDAFLYSPAFAQALWPLAQLPWPVFAALFVVLPAAAFWWLLRPLPRGWVLPLWLMTLPEIVTGNVFWLLALVAAVGLRHPGGWAFAALTKITPCLGPVWFLARREWRQLAWFAVISFAVTVASILLDPDAWREWLVFLADNAGGSGHALGIPILPPLVVRAPLAVVLVVVAARTDRRHLLPVAMVLATPVVAIASFTMLTAIPRLVRSGRDDPSRTEPAAPASLVEDER